MAGIEVEDIENAQEEFYDSYNHSVLTEGQDADNKAHSTPKISGVNAIPADPIPSLPEIAQSQNAPLSDPTAGGHSFSCQNGTSVNNGVHTDYLSTNGDEKLGGDNSIIDVDDDNKNRIDSLSAYGRTQEDKTITLVGLTQVQKLKPDHDPKLLGAEGNQLDKERKYEDREQRI